MTSPPEHLRLRPDAVEWRAVEGEVVALDLRRSLYLAVNPAGAELWDLLAEGTDRESLVGRLQQRFGISAERAAEDVDAFLSDLRGHDLLA